MFPEIPEDFSSLSDEEVRQYVTTAREALDAVRANPNEFLSEDRTAAELLSQMAEAVDAIEAAVAALASRVPEDFEAQVAELAGRVAEDDEDEENEETDDEDETETVSAVIEPLAEEEKVEEKAGAVALRRPARSRSAEPKIEFQPTAEFRAAVHGEGLNVGDIVSSDQIAHLMMRKRSQWPSVIAKGDGEKYTVAKMDWRNTYGDERKLGDDDGRNMSLIAAATNPFAIRQEFDRRRSGSLVAAGGLCAPTTPYYNRQTFSTDERPVRAALPSFSATRGGIRFNRGMSIGNITTAIDTHTVAEDALGGTSAAKTCQTIACPSITEVTIVAISHCIQVGNIAARTFPELVAQFSDLVMASQARTAETLLLDAIGTASTAVTAAQQVSGSGAVADLLPQIGVAAAAFRSRHRMAPDAVLRAIFPRYLLDLLVSDSYRQQFSKYDMTPERFVALIRAYNVEPSWTIDGATGAGQVFGVQAAGQLNVFPTDVRWYLYPEGTFLFLDGGSLELGIVRDSTLNQSNDYQVFGETFEALAMVGVESLQITSVLSDTGANSLALAFGNTDY